jgi:hypothetical protein
MIHLEGKFISNDLVDVHFACDLLKCKGACCVEGDAGAPLEEEEISLLEDYVKEIFPFMLEAGVTEVKNTGVFCYDTEGKYVTPLVKGRECAFVVFENEIARCAIEIAFQAGKIPFQKPVSCHLYPVRIRKLHDGEGMNYHKWSICKKALENGMKLKMPLYMFLEEALIRKYGRNWYNRFLKLLH